MLHHHVLVFSSIFMRIYIVQCFIIIELIKNGRIQLFRLNQRNGSTKLTIKLIYPTGIVLDGDQYLFIVDQGNHRIIGSDENGFRCIFGCSGYGSTNDKLTYPHTMSFDSYGNIYVTDRYNHRIQKISLSKKSDRKYENCSIFSKSTL